MHEESKASFYKPDVFHTVTLGIGKTFAASSLAYLQELYEGTSIEARFESLTADYLEFCKDLRLNISLCVIRYKYIRNRFGFHTDRDHHHNNINSIHANIDACVCVCLHMRFCRNITRRTMSKRWTAHFLGGKAPRSRLEHGARGPLRQVCASLYNTSVNAVI